MEEIYRIACVLILELEGHTPCQEAKFLPNTLSSSPSNTKFSTQNKLVYIYYKTSSGRHFHLSHYKPLEKFDLKVNYRDMFKYALRYALMCAFVYMCAQIPPKIYFSITFEKNCINK